MWWLCFIRRGKRQRTIEDVLAVSQSDLAKAKNNCDLVQKKGAYFASD